MVDGLRLRAEADLPSPIECSQAELKEESNAVRRYSKAETGVRVNCVTPAVVETRILDEFTPEQVQYMLGRIPMGRFGEIEEIAAMVAWLSSAECSFSTGAVFDITGGRSTY